MLERVIMGRSREMLTRNSAVEQEQVAQQLHGDHMKQGNVVEDQMVENGTGSIPELEQVPEVSSISFQKKKDKSISFAFLYYFFACYCTNDYFLYCFPVHC